MFAKKKVSLPPGRHKIIILDEADKYDSNFLPSLPFFFSDLIGFLVRSMTSAAQQALRRIMEEYSSTTRFALACNISSNIIEPIQSRCAILRFQRLQDQQIYKRLMVICEKENVGFNLL